MSSPPPISLVPLPLVLSTLALSAVGFIGNAIIIAATVRSSQLQNRCGFLICLLATVDLVISGYLVQLRVMQLYNVYLITNHVCFLHSIHGIFCLSFQSGLGFSIGVDRLLAVIKPIKYKNLPISIHVFLVLCAFLYAVIITSIGAFDVSEQIIPVCMPPTAFNVTSRMVWIVASFAVGILTLFVYGAAHYECSKMGRTVERTNRTSFLKLRRLLISLTIVVGVYALTWFLTVCALLVTQVLARDTPLARMVEQQLAWLVIINTSSNFFIYSWRAPEYRKAFVSLIFPCTQKSRRDGGTSTYHLGQATSSVSLTLTRNTASQRW